MTGEEKPGVYPLRDHIGALVHEVARFRKAAFDKEYQALDLTRSQRLVLIHITQFEGKGVNQKDLADRMKLSPVSLGEKLNALEKRGWIERRTDPGDRRQKLIFLTDAGRAVLDRSSRIARTLNAHITAGIAPGDVSAAEDVLKAMRATLLKMNAAPSLPPDGQADD